MIWRRSRSIALATLALALLGGRSPAAEEAMALGRAALTAERPREARTALRAAIAAAPSWGAAHALQARASLMLGDAVAAEAELARAHANGVAPAILAPARAELALLRGDGSGALGELSGASGAEAARLTGRALLMLGALPRAEAAFGAAITLAPDDAANWIALARFRIAAGDTRGATGASDRAVALAPRSAQAHMLRATLVRTQFGLVASLPWFEAALERDADHVPALIEYAATLGEAGRAREMLATTRRALALDPAHPRAWFLQAALAARAGQFGLARALFARARGRLDGEPAAMLLASVLEIEAGGYQQALTRLDRLVARQPDNVAARRLLALARLRSGDARGSLVVLAPLVDQADAEPWALALAGRAHEALGDRVAAGRALDLAALARRGDPVALPVREGAAPESVQRVRLAFGTRRDALAAALAARDGTPGAAATHILVGDALAARGDFAGAARALADAANIEFSERIALRLIDALGRAGKADEARATLGLALAQHPRSRALILLAAEARMNGGDARGAARLLDALRRREGARDAVVLTNLAWSWLKAGEPLRALAFARAAYALAPANPVVADTHGWMLLQAGRGRGAALALLEKADAIAPGAAGLHLREAQTRLARR